MPEILVLSNRADLISGGDALVEIKLPAGRQSRVRQDRSRRGAASTARFAVRPNGRYHGLVTGLTNGTNVADRPTQIGRAQITITNHAIGGPVFSGAQVQPWICTTKVTSPTLDQPGPRRPARRQVQFAASVYRYRYRTLSQRLREVRPGEPACRRARWPTTTDEGKTVPYIVRIERGIINRGNHEIA